MTIIEVSPRDGLQNEKIAIPTSDKLDLIRALLASGLEDIEVTSFVSPKWVPQLADASALWELLPSGMFSALIPNLRGLERALAVGVKRISIFTAASEPFVQQNMGMTIEESLDGFRQVVNQFREVVPDGFVRGYVSTIVRCPFAGDVSPGQVEAVAKRLWALGIDEISFGETLGVAVPRQMKRLFPIVAACLPKEKVAWHFHDTWGTAIANVECAMEEGFTRFDASAGGLGGCPYAPGAGGNLATEDLVAFLEANGVQTGINLPRLAAATLPILGLLGRLPASKAQLAVRAACP